jgi:hypothetical protein
MPNLIPYKKLGKRLIPGASMVEGTMGLYELLKAMHGVEEKSQTGIIEKIDPKTSGYTQHISQDIIDMGELIDDGAHTEHEEIAKDLETFIYDMDEKGIDRAVSNINYPVYKQDIEAILKSKLGKSFKVYRVPGLYGSADFKKKHGMKSKYESYSYNPHFQPKNPDRVSRYIKPEDVVAFGHTEEGEVILKRNIAKSKKDPIGKMIMDAMKRAEK